MDKLLKFISGYLNAADLRGVDPENPIPFVTRASEGEFVDKKFILQVGFAEPTFNMLPYNVLWICFDKELPYHAKLMRRVGHTPSALTPELKYTWVELVDFSEVYEKEQFYRPIADLDLVDSDQQVDPILQASKESLGTVKTETTVVEPRAILATDKRLSNAREPLPHVHDNTARSMLKLFHYEVPSVDAEGNPILGEDGEQLKELKRAYVRVDTAFPPTDGCMLFLQSRDPENENIWNAVWRKANANDIVSLEPQPIDIVIVKPTEEFGDNTNYTFTAKFIMSDSAPEKPATNVTWSVSANSLGITINPVSGQLSIPDLEADTPLTVTVTYTENGKTITDSVDILLKNTHVPVVATGLLINGADRVDETKTSNYEVLLVMSDGTKTKITPDSFTSDIEAAAIINTAGLLTSYNVDANTRVTLTAQYTHNGDTFTKTKEVIIVDLQAVEGFEIRGSAAIDEETSATYQCFVTYTDGSELLVSPDTFVISSGSDHASLNGLTLTANDVVNDQTVVLTAAVAHKGQNLSKTKTVQIRDLDKYPRSIEILGNSSMNEGTNQTVTVDLIYDDNSREALQPSQVTLVSANELISVDGFVLTAGNTTSNRTVTITATYANNGSPLSDTLRVDVVNTSSTQTGIEISSASQMDELSTIDLTIRRVYDDGSKNSEVSFDNYTYEVTPSDLASIEVGTPPVMKLKSTKFIKGDQKVRVAITNPAFPTVSKEITIRDNASQIIGWHIEGDAEFFAGDTDVKHEYRVFKENDVGGSVLDNALAWRITTGSEYIELADNNSGKINVIVKDKDLTANVNAVIEAQYALPEEAPTWKQFNITIKPLAANTLTYSLFGDTEVNEGATTGNYVAKVSYKSLWTEECPLTLLEINGDAHGAVVRANTVVAPTDLTANKQISLVGKLSWKGAEQVTANKTLTLVNSIADFKNATFKNLAATYNAGDEINPTAIQITMSDNSKRDATLSTLEVTSGEAAVVVAGSGASTRITVKADLAVDTNVTIRGTIVDNGVTRQVNAFTFKALKKASGYPFKSGVVMTPCDLFPTAYRDNLGLVMNYFSTDKNAFEITAAHGQTGSVNVDIDSFGYPGHDPSDMPWNGMIIVSKTISPNQPRIRDRDTNFEGGWDSAAWTNFVEPDASNSIDPTGQQMGPITVTFEGEDYWVFKSDWPMLDFLTKIKIEF